MSLSLSPNAQAVLLLTAPLIFGRSEQTDELLRPSEYQKLARLLRNSDRLPGDLFTPDGSALLTEFRTVVDPDRIQRLLGRGFQLSQAFETLANTLDLGDEYL